MDTQQMHEGDERDLPVSARTRFIGRRKLLRGAAAIGLGLPFATRALNGSADEDMDQGHGDMATPTTGEPAGTDHDGEQHTEEPMPSQPVESFALYDPSLASVQAGVKNISIVAKDAVRYIAKDVPYAVWTYDGTVPGRTIRVVEGDTVNVSFRVDGSSNAHHSLDFHSAKTPPNINYRTIEPGEELTWSFVASVPGAYMYHCGTPRILMHIGAGMYGAMIVDPKEGWSPAQELILVQSDFYLKDSGNGVMSPDYDKMLGHGDMDYVAFNGHANQYVDNPIKVKIGEPIRVFVVNAGPNAWSSFHVVGTIFDRVCVNANPKNQLFGLQSITIGPGDSASVEFTLDEPGTYPAVNHAIGHAAHGAIALLQAE